MKSTAVRRALVGASVCALTVVGLGVGAASAGEITGSGQLKEVKGNSLCAYSGRNDGYINPALYAESPEDALVRVQNWGTDKKLGTLPPSPLLELFHPGKACNPNIGLPFGE